MSNQRGDLVAQITKASSFAEQMGAVQALDDFDRRQHEAQRQERSIDLAGQVVAQTLTPVRTHELNTIATDWIGDFEPLRSTGSHNAAIAEAALWFGRTSPEVRADVEEFGVQAEGFMRREASRYGEDMAAVYEAGLSYLGFLWRREGASGLDQIQQTVDPHDDPRPTQLNTQTFDNFAPEVDPINAGVVGTETSERNPLLQEIMQEGNGQGAPEKPGGHSIADDFSNSYSEVPLGAQGAKEAQADAEGPWFTPSMAIAQTYTMDDFRRQGASGLDEIQQVVNPHEDPSPTPLPTQVAFPWLISPDAYGNEDGEDDVAKTVARRTGAPFPGEVTKQASEWTQSDHTRFQADPQGTRGPSFNPSMSLGSPTDYTSGYDHGVGGHESEGDSDDYATGYGHGQSDKSHSASKQAAKRPVLHVMTADDYDPDAKRTIPAGAHVLVHQISSEGDKDGHSWAYATHDGHDVVLDPSKISPISRRPTATRKQAGGPVVHPKGSRVFVPHFMGGETQDGQKGDWATVIAEPGQHEYKDRNEEHLMRPENPGGTPFFQHFGSSKQSHDCRNGNHTSCSAKTCDCSCHDSKHQRSGACADGDHGDCKMGANCSCKCHNGKRGSRKQARMDCGCPDGTHAEGGRGHQSFAEQAYAAGTHDAWGRPLMQPGDGHGAWDCNNYGCTQHPNSLYKEQPGVQSLPGWMGHESTRKQADMFGGSDLPHAVPQPGVANSPGTTPNPGASYADGVKDAQDGDRPTFADASSAAPQNVSQYSQGYADGAHAREGQPEQVPSLMGISASFVMTGAMANPDFTKAYRFASSWRPGKPLVTTGSLEFESGLYAGIADNPAHQQAWLAAHRRQARKDARFGQRLEVHEAYTAHLASRGIDITAAIPGYESGDTVYHPTYGKGEIEHVDDEGAAHVQYEQDGRNESHPQGTLRKRRARDDDWGSSWNVKTSATSTELDTMSPEASPSPTGQTPINGPGAPGPLAGGMDAAAPGGPSPYNGAPPYGAPVVPTGISPTPGSHLINDIPGGPADGNVNPATLAFRKVVQSALLAQKKG